ncbi:MAG: phosphate uptake regulator PhoU [Nanoarchaeota archaeon]|nr:phosphate uptake regulator PhoU [Nanoarchaeota archaeon]
MKRKVIQIANSTQLISLPRKWAVKHGIKKGDEIDVEEQGNKLIIDTEKGVDLERIELDITGLDRSSIMYYMRSAYRKGYDEIAIKFDDPLTTHFRLNKKLKVLSIIHTEVNRLVGVEIIKQTENFCLIKDISQSSIKEFDNVLRRIFLLLKDTNNDLMNGLKKRDFVLAETIEEKHDTITKFVSYCLRLLNKYGYEDSKKTAILYHTIASLDKITDIMKYVARDTLIYKPTLKKESKATLDLINNSMESYFDLFYKFEKNKIMDFTRNRDQAIKMIKSSSKKISSEEVRLLNTMGGSLEILLDLVEARMSLEH